MSTAESVEGTADEMPSEPGNEVAVVAPAQNAVGAFIAGERPEDIIATAATIANALKGLIEQQDMSKSMGGGRKHVEVGAWQACGMMLGALGGQPLHAETAWTRIIASPDGTPLTTPYDVTERNGNHYTIQGHDWESCVEVKTPAGVVVGRAEAMCSRSEGTWAKRDEYAVRSMAETRAESRAFRRAIGWVVHMAGYSPTPAEEMGHEPGQSMGTPAAAPSWTAPASDELTTTMRNAIGYLAGADAIDALVAKLLADTDGEIVAAVARAILFTATAVQQARAAAAPPEGDPA